MMAEGNGSPRQIHPSVPMVPSISLPCLLFQTGCTAYGTVLSTALQAISLLLTSQWNHGPDALGGSLPKLQRAQRPWDYFCEQIFVPQSRQGSSRAGLWQGTWQWLLSCPALQRSLCVWPCNTQEFYLWFLLWEGIPCAGTLLLELSGSSPTFRTVRLQDLSCSIKTQNIGPTGTNCALTWNTVRRDWGKLSNVLLLVCISSKLNLPPKSCIPRREKMMMKRKRSSNREAMERTEFSSEATRLLREFQYLREKIEAVKIPSVPDRCSWTAQDIGSGCLLCKAGISKHPVKQWIIDVPPWDNETYCS